MKKIFTEKKKSWCFTPLTAQERSYSSPPSSPCSCTPQAEAAAVPGEGGQSHELQPSEVGARLCPGPLGDTVTMRWDRHGLEGVLLLPLSAEVC